MRKLLYSFVVASLFLTFFTASAQQFNTGFWQKRSPLALNGYANTTSLVALWQLDENPNVINNSVIYDYFGTHNGVFTGPASGNKSITGVRFRGLDTSGGSYNVTVPASTDFNRSATPTVTIMGWFQLTTTAADQLFFAVPNYGASGSGKSWGLETISSTSIGYWDTNSDLTGTVPTMTTGVWYHVALVLNGANAKIYFNGNQILSATANVTARTNTSLYIGRSTFGTSTYAPMKHDEISYWNRALSATEIQTIFTSQGFATANDIYVYGPLKAFNITSTSFDVSAKYLGDNNGTGSGTLYYCDATVSVGCDPTTGSSISLTESSGSLIGSVTGISSASGHFINLKIIGVDSDGTSGTLTDTLRLTSTVTPTIIYRSVGSGASTALATGGAGNTLTISSTTATFSAAQATNIGVGDVIQYDSVSDASTPTQNAFISGRTSSTVYTVLTSTGGTPAAYTGLTHWQILRSYTSLKNAIAGTENSGLSGSTALKNFDAGSRNIVTNNERWMIALYGNGVSADAATTAISGWTTDADRYIQVYTPVLSTEVGVSQRPAGVWDTSKYHISFSDTNSSACRLLCVQQPYTRIIGIQVENTATTGQSDTFDFSTGAAGEEYIGDSIFRFTTTAAGSGKNCAYLTSLPTNTKAYFYNNILSGCGVGLGLDSGGAASTTFTLDNNTIYGCGYDGIRLTDMPATVKINMTNNIVYNNLTDIDLQNSHSSTVTNYTNLTKDTSGTQTTLTFNNAASGDFHLGAGDTSAMGTGTDLSVPNIDSNFKFTEDIDNQTRPTGSWDIGADQH